MPSQDNAMSIGLAILPLINDLTRKPEMSSKQPTTSPILDLDTLSKAVGALKANTYSFGQEIPKPSLDQGLGGASKTKKSPEEQAEDRLEKAIKDAVDTARQQIHRRIINTAILERVRNVINQEFGKMLSPAQIDRYASEASKVIGYKLSDIKVLPKSIMPSTVIADNEHALVPSDSIDDL